jgi:glycosyltransferase involved in cell wall biosynthesis
MRLIDLSPFENSINYNLSVVNNVSILIKTLERESHLIQLLKSISNLGFNGPIFIADDSKVPYEESIREKFSHLNISYLQLPYNTGLAEGRNQMLKGVSTPYFLLCDDDFVFDKRTRVPLMVSLLENHKLDLLGGVFFQHNRKTRIGKLLLKINYFFIRYKFILPSFQFYEYHAGFRILKNKISLFSISYKNPVTICDMTHNFFLARTEKVKSFGGWNSILKVGEHENFFIRAKLAGLKVGTTRMCGVVHDQWTLNSEAYKSLRIKAVDYQKLALEEFGINSLENYKDVLGGSFGS